IDVKVDEGWVTLTGDVSYQFESDAAFEDVADMLGVVGVTNSIRVTTPGAIGLAVGACARRQPPTVRRARRGGRDRLRGRGLRLGSPCPWLASTLLGRADAARSARRMRGA